MESEIELERLAHSAQLLAMLLLRELDAPTIDELDASGARPLLDELGLSLPQSSDTEALNELGAEYFRSILNPQEYPPLIQSLAQGGTYEAEPARQIREIAEALKVEFDKDSARGAAVDHLGCELMLWSEIILINEEEAHEVTRRHLAWAVPVLALRTGNGFYDRLSAIVRDFIGLLVEAAKAA